MADSKKQSRHRTSEKQPSKGRQASSLASFFFFFACYIRFNMWKSSTSLNRLNRPRRFPRWNLPHNSVSELNGNPKSLHFWGLEGFQPWVFRGYVYRGCTFFHEWIFQGHPMNKMSKSYFCLFNIQRGFTSQKQDKVRSWTKGCMACVSCTPPN